MAGITYEDITQAVQRLKEDQRAQEGLVSIYPSLNDGKTLIAHEKYGYMDGEEIDCPQIDLTKGNVFLE